MIDDKSGDGEGDEDDEDWLAQGWRSESGSWFRDKAMHVEMSELWFLKKGLCKMSNNDDRGGAQILRAG